MKTKKHKILSIVVPWSNIPLYHSYWLILYQYLGRAISTLDTFPSFPFFVVWKASLIGSVENLAIILQENLLSTFAINWSKQRATPYSKLRSSWCAPPAVIIRENHLIYIHSTKFTHKIWQTKNSSKQQKTHYNTMIIAITMLTKTLPI